LIYGLKAIGMLLLVTLGYTCMLILMTYDIPLCLMIVLGNFLGFLVFFPRETVVENSTTDIQQDEATESLKK